MAREQNFLLGNGERLTGPVKVPKGGGPKNPPYDFATAQSRVAKKLATTTAALDGIPAEACPNNEVVAVVTMHPRYVSKSDFPSQLLGAVGLRAVGSRSRSIEPESWGIDEHPKTAIAEDYFVAGTKTAFSRWSSNLPSWSATSVGAEDLSHVEDVAPLTAAEKLRSIPEGKDHALFEVVVHEATDRVLKAFDAYATKHGGTALMSRRRDVKGLAFIPVRAPSSKVQQIAAFSFVRVLRGMPSLRPFRPGILRNRGGFAVRLPVESAVNPKVRALVFDGGIPSDVDLSKWVRTLEPSGIGKAIPEYMAHGLGVTTALLFGPLAKGVVPSRPLCSVDHVRVLDDRSGVDDEEMLYVDVLDRILATLDRDGASYDFVNISLGPRLAMTDDEVTAWTASLDERLAKLRLVATVAAGNDGERDSSSGLNRVQPPADGVNVVAVGAVNQMGDGWIRADYSCVGPGRSPGIVKPDGVSFGGSDREPFMVLAPTKSAQAIGEQGTSFAAPFALRSAVGLRVQLGEAIGPLAIRALMIHRADQRDHGQANVGWGRFEPDHENLITTADDEAIVIYQGDLPVGEHLRAGVPMPKETLTGKITIGATLVISPEVDPNHPSAYTRSGLEISFRPHALKYGSTKGKRSAHPKTKSFFSATNMYAAEYDLREDGHKWEPCLRNIQTFMPKSLEKPCFDIYYHHREAGSKADAPQPIPYALIVSLRAPKVTDLYNRVVRTYANVLVPLKPQVRVPIRTHT
jgi:hypothetical protein